MSDISTVLLLLLITAALLLIALLRNARRGHVLAINSRLDALDKAQERSERTVREELARSRDEFGTATRDQRQELSDAFKSLTNLVVQRVTEIANMQKAQLDSFSAHLASFAKASGERLDVVRAESASGAKQLREEVVATLGGMSDTMTKTMTGLASAQNRQFEAVASHLASFAQSSGEKLEAIRIESATGAKQLRQEVVSTLSSISETMVKTMKDLAVSEKAQLDAFSAHVNILTKTSSEKLDAIRVDTASGAKQLRDEVIAALRGITEANIKTMAELGNAQKGQLETLSSAIAKLSESNTAKLEALRATVEGSLHNMRVENAQQLDQMRQTVDEKLQSTLEKRLGESFKQVSERLEQVHKGLGEMQALATGVGDLKKVLTNIKTRGTWGEVQLGALLEQVLSPDQFAANVATKEGSERVEFAIKLPGQALSNDEFVWLPIDAKFPLEDYQRLIDAQESGDVETVELSRKVLESRVKGCAHEICDRYLNPPRTTDFAILFLPIEGLFAEVIRSTGLTEVIQREYRVVIAGPTTLWSILNSLQMGFRTLAIQKRSSEVWNLLAAVKTEWTKYGDMLEAVQKKLHQASDTIEKAKVRSRVVGRKLKDVQELPISEATTLLPLHILEDDSEPGPDSLEAA
jgi:DNA recombination protein RmuC